MLLLRPLALTVLAALPGCAAEAQPPGGPESAARAPVTAGGATAALPPRAERRLARWTARLDLSAEQVALLREAMTRAHVTRRDARRRFAAALSDILTPEQARRMRAAREATRPRRSRRARETSRARRSGRHRETSRARRSGRHARRGRRMMRRLARELSLDDRQKEQIRAALREARREHRASGVDPRSLPRERRRALRRQRLEAAAGRIEAVLRPDQRERFQALRARMEARSQNHDH